MLIVLIAEGNVMDVFNVSLFGHREIRDLRGVDIQLFRIIEDLLRTKIYVGFLIGRNGVFDEYAASLIKRCQKEIKSENSDMTLVLPYAVADISYYEKYYDNIIIPECMLGVHPKSAIGLRNRWMVEHSDLVIVFAEYDSGGAYNAMRYAIKLNKRIIRINRK